MTVCFRCTLVPRDRSLRPAEERIEALVDRLTQEGYLEASPEQGRQRSRWQGGGLLFRFQVNSDIDDWETLGLPYPFDRGADEPGYHDIIVYSSDDLVLRSTDSPPDTRCRACQAELLYEVDNPDRMMMIDLTRLVRAACPACGARLDANAPGVARQQGALSCFAVVIDCEEGWPREGDSQEQALKAEALGRAGYGAVTDLFGQPIPPPGPRAPREATTEPAVQSPYGDLAPPLSRAFLSLVEEAIGAPFDLFPEFY